MRKIAKGLGALAAAGLLLLVAASPAVAHPKVVSTSPSDGATVDSPPSEVSVEFDEVVTNADLDVFDPCGAQVDNGNPQALGREVSVGMAADKAGTYTVRWEVISEDSHNVRGDWTFTSSGGAACPGSGGGGGGGGKSGRGGGGTGGGSGGEGDDGDSFTLGGGGSDGGSDTSTQASGDGDGGAGKHADHETGGKNSKDKKKPKHQHTDDPREVDLVGEDSGGRKDGTDLPVDWLLISFGIAGLIGAAGGSIYASIVGPR